MKKQKSFIGEAFSDKYSSNNLTDKYPAKPIRKALIDRSESLIQAYSTLYNSTVHHIGDADSYFKKTLRNYSFNILSSSRSIDNKHTKRRQIGQGDFLRTKVADTHIHTANILSGITKKDYFAPKSQNQTDIMAEDDLNETANLVEESNKELETMENEIEPKDDKAILKEVEECEAQCMEIYKILNELKQRVSELLSKSSRTPQEDQELEVKQKLLNEKMAMLEQKTRRIELLVGQTKKPDFDKAYDEDSLPKVVVCGLAENNMPKFIICDDKKRRSTGRKPPCSPLLGPAPTCPMSYTPPTSNPPCPPPCMPSPCPPPCMPCPMPPCTTPGPMPLPCPRTCPPSPLPPPCISVMPQFAKRLSDSYDMQERLAQENADLEGKRYKLQEDLLNKDQTVESLQRQLTSIQTELRMVVKENGLLNSQLQQCPAADPCCSPPPCPAMPCCSRPCTPRPSSPCCGDVPKPCRRAPCPAMEQAQETRKLEKQLTEMETEVRAIQNELSTVRQERLHLEQHRRMMSAPPAPPCPVPCAPPCPPRPDNTQIRELREQYNILQDNYKSKMIEVSGLRADVEKLKTTTAEAVESKKAMEDKLRELDKIVRDYKLNEAKNGQNKEHMIEVEQQITVTKQRFREAQDELEEMRALSEEQQGQLDDYRNKYLEAQQEVEEQKRSIDLMELDNNRIGEQVNLEIQRVKNQFQEKLQELTPLPDILKATQIKLQEAQQMHLMAERNNEALLRELQSLRDKATLIAEEIEKSSSKQTLDEAEKQDLVDRNEILERRVEELLETNLETKMKMEELLLRTEDSEKKADEKSHEIAQLSAEVENVREEAGRQVARVKDRCETIRRSMSNQVTDLEKQLAQSRAQAKAAQKDRDEIRQKMQCQINNLNENFEDAQMRIRTLQGHVNFLKTSAAVYPSGDSCPQ